MGRLGALWPGDCLGLLPEVPDTSVDLIASDLPYGCTDAAWDRVIDPAALWGHFRRVLKPTGAVVLTAVQPFATDLINAGRAWFRQELVWDKRRVTGHLNAKRRPLRAHENILVFSPRAHTYHPQMVPAKPRRFNRPGQEPSELYRGKRRTASDNGGLSYPTTVLTFRQTRDGRHSTPKPAELMAWIVATYSSPGDLILDVAAGSGSTGLACAAAGRRFLGMEIRPDVARIAAAELAEAYRRAHPDHPEPFAA